MKTRAARAKESALSKNAENHRENAIGDDFEVDPNLQGTHTDSGKGQPESGCEAGKMNEQQEGSVNGEVEVDAGNDEKSAAKKWTRRRNQLVFGRVDSFYRYESLFCGFRFPAVSRNAEYKLGILFGPRAARDPCATLKLDLW